MEHSKWLYVSAFASGFALLFILAYAAIYFGVSLHWWDAPSEGVAIAMSALIALIVPAGPLWNRVSKVKVWEIEFELAAVAASQVETPTELGGEATQTLGPSYIDIILARLETVINQAPQAKLLTLNINVGPAWWSTRVFLVAALAQEFMNIQRIVFVEDCAGPDDCFIGSASPQAICRAFVGRQPFLSQAYQAAPVRNNLRTVGMAFAMWFASQGPDNEAQQQETMTKQKLREWLGQDLIQGYVEWHDGPPPVWMLRKILNQPELFVALVQCGRLKLLIDRQALSVRLAEHALPS